VALTLGAAAGVDVDQIPAALEGGFADSPLLREYVRGLKDDQLSGVALQISALVKLLQGEVGRAPRGSLARILLKDMHIVRQLSHAHNATLPVTSLVTSLFELLDRVRARE
jgi:3-hydroxyisobutyrate dehydrogenase